MHYISTIKPLGSQPHPSHVRCTISDRADNYLLEINNHCEASPKLLALAALAPELEEFLELIDSPMANMISDRWREIEMKLHTQMREHRKAAG